MLFKEEISFPVIMRRQINYVDNILLNVTSRSRIRVNIRALDEITFNLSMLFLEI